VAAGRDSSALPLASGLSETISLIRSHLTGSERLIADGSLSREGLRFSSRSQNVRVVEVATRWSGGADEANRVEARILCDVAVALGSSLIVACCLDAVVDQTMAAAGLQALADIAGEAGCSVCVEWLPYAGISHIREVADLIQAVSRPNVGYLIDSLHWHYQPGGPDWEALKGIDPAQVLFVQLSDARPEDETSPGAEPSKRRIPGDGDIELIRLIRTLADMGAEPFVAAEVFNSDLLGRLGPAEFATMATDAAREVLDVAVR